VDLVAYRKLDRLHIGMAATMVSTITDSLNPATSVVNYIHQIVSLPRPHYRKEQSMECHYCKKEIETGRPLFANGEPFCNNLCRRNFEKGIAPPAQQPIETASVKPAFEQIVGHAAPATDAGAADQPVSYRIRGKEYLYLYIKFVVTLGILGLVAYYASLHIQNTPVIVATIIGYGLTWFLCIWIIQGIMIGWIRGNAVKISESQFPDIYAILHRQATLLKIQRIPDLYVIQAGGALNAMAARFAGKNYVILYADIMETAYEKGPATLAFVIGHELGHIKRRHMIKNMALLPSMLVPFLQPAYSRACEYTCDNIGKALSPAGANDGMLIIAIGKQLFRKVNLDVYRAQLKTAGGFWVWLAEKVSSHPHIPNRLKNIASGD
jgi:Zn-dependent protease with chaperone function